MLRYAAVIALPRSVFEDQERCAADEYDELLAQPSATGLRAWCAVIDEKKAALDEKRCLKNEEPKVFAGPLLVAIKATFV